MASKAFKWTIAAVALLVLVSVGVFWFLAWAGVDVHTHGTPPPLRVAAASDLNPSLDELIQDFRRSHATDIQVIYGASGTLFAQLQNGAPYDVFLSADRQYPQRLIPQQAVPLSLFSFAHGRLVFWVRSDSPLAPEQTREHTLTHPRLSKLAIANPDHAPYGRAAMAALEHFKLTGRLKPKLVFGENVAQAAQFAQSGAADAGLIALSSAHSEKMRGGKYWIIPQEAHPPIEQTAVILSRAQQNPAAAAFVSYLKTPAAASILRKYGFEIPGIP